MNTPDTLAGMINPFIAPPASADAAPSTGSETKIADATERAGHDLKFQKRRRSPNEEYAARVAASGPMMKVPKSLVGFMLHVKNRVKVTRNGITLKKGRTQDSLRYFDAASKTCHPSNVGNKVVVTGHLHLTARATGRDIKSDFVHVITVENGRWQRFRDFMNTAEAVAAFST